ncbi:MAG TPA: endonuclease domain-containing protein [Stellaceae bacterium]|nr:endonuclease domain-containing protein [Stellaceae bacterium]
MSEDFVRQLRANQTDAEAKLWQHLRRKGIAGLRFRRQFPLGPYIVDFVCLGKWLVIELDGGQHAERVNADVRRTEWLNEQGFEVVRFWNNDVLSNIEGVLTIIRQRLD